MLTMGLKTDSNWNDIGLFVFSDTHVYARSVATSGILNGCTDIINRAVERGVKIFLLTGDFFDRQLPVNTDEYTDIQMWINGFLSKCNQNNIILRILEGTPSHDCGQCKMFIEMNESREEKYRVDVRHVKSIEIEYIESLDLNLLYVPDQTSSPVEVTMARIDELLNIHGLDKVDIALTHAYWDYQLPSHQADHGFKPSDFKKRVRYAVFNGHIHTPTSYGIVHTVGSTARTSHNEEEEKGGIYGRLTRTSRVSGTLNLSRINNPHTVLFKTIDIRGLSMEESMATLKPWLSSPDGSNLRPWYNRGDAFDGAIGDLIREYPQFKWKTKVEKEERKLSKTLVSLEEKYEGVEITPTSLPDLLREKFSAVHDDAAVSSLLKRLEEVL